jgi:hypothetical protein
LLLELAADLARHGGSVVAVAEKTNGRFAA